MATAPFTVQPRLTQIALAVRNELFIADEVSPRVAVPAEKFICTQFETAEQFTIPDSRVGRTSRANQVEFGATDITESTLDWGLEDPVPLKDVKSAQGTNFDPLAVATEGVTHLVDLSREARVAAQIFALATYLSTQRTTLSGTGQWSHADSDPIAVILAAMDQMLVRPNTLVLGQSVATALRTHPKVVEAVVGTGAARGVVSLEALADKLELDRIRVGRSWYNAAKKGQTASYSRLWGKHASLLYLDPNMRSARTVVPTFCFTAQWMERKAGTYLDGSRGTDGVEVVKVVEHVKEVIVHQGAGYHWHDAVA